MSLTKRWLYIFNCCCYGPQQISKGSFGQYYIGMYVNLDKSFR